MKRKRPYCLSCNLRPRYDAWFCKECYIERQIEQFRNRGQMKEDE